MRIESVRFDASGSSTIAVSGGVVFFLPSRRLSELHERLSALIPPEVMTLGSREGLEYLALQGIELEEHEPFIQELSNMDEEERALRKGASLCSTAEQHRAGLKLKLKSKGFSAKAVERALDRLEAEAVLDDARYAALWARARLRRKPMGPFVLTAELRAKGLGAEAVRRTLEEIDFSKILPEAARREIEQKGTDRDTLKAALRRQGFGYEVLSKYFEDSGGTGV